MIRASTFDPIYILPITLFQTTPLSAIFSRNSRNVNHCPPCIPDNMTGSAVCVPVPAGVSLGQAHCRYSKPYPSQGPTGPMLSTAGFINSRASRARILSFNSIIQNMENHMGENCRGKMKKSGASIFTDIPSFSSKRWLNGMGCNV